jgi:16S rRNA (uracil1498-N3)-methyltransferase
VGDTGGGSMSHRFFIPAQNIRGAKAILVEEQAHQIGRVLRLLPGEQLFLIANGVEYQAEITACGANRVECRLLGSRLPERDPELTVTVIQCLPKGDKMDLIIQKATELGAARIWPALSQRTVKRPAGERAAKQQRRWERIAVEAAEQCGRLRWPEIAEPCPLPELLADSPGPGVVAWEGEGDASLKDHLQALRETPSLTVLVGPEGGLTEQEVVMAQASGLQPVSLGPRILRAETAVIALLTAIMYELGDMGGLPR